MLLTCEEVRVLLNAYVDGETDAEEREAVRAHLSVCPDCRAELAALEELHRLFPPSFEEYPEQLHEGIMNALAAQRESVSHKAKPRRRVLGVLSKIAVSVLIVVLAFPLAYRWIPTKRASEGELYPELMASNVQRDLGVWLYPVGSNVWESRAEGFATTYRLCYRGEIAVLTIDGTSMTGTVEFAEDGVAYLCLQNQRIYRLVAVESGAYLLLPED